MKKILKTLKILLLYLILSFPLILFSQQQTAYVFTEIKRNPATPIKNQNRTITCWSFSGLSFFESELLRMNKGEYDLSEMFVVRNIFSEKTIKYSRMQGKINFSGGGAFNDVILVFDKYGIVPEEVYTGLEYGEEKHNHSELDNVLKAYMEEIVKMPGRKLSTAWHEGVMGILDAYLGKFPSEFHYKNKTFTPRSFASSLDLKTADYVMLTSFTHHPFYKSFVLEVPDNWDWGIVHNITIDELIEVIDNAVIKGYTVAWASDTSEKGFNWKAGIAVVPSEDPNTLEEDERNKWEKLGSSDRQDLFHDFSRIRKEIVVTQEMRQAAFDNQTTTDDHGMHITGIARNQSGDKFYIVKNSWGTEGNPYNGYLYASEQYVKFKTTSILVNKSSIPQVIRKKLGI